MMLKMSREQLRNLLRWVTAHPTRTNLLKTIQETGVDEAVVAAGIVDVAEAVDVGAAETVETVTTTSSPMLPRLHRRMNLINNQNPIPMSPRKGVEAGEVAAAEDDHDQVTVRTAIARTDRHGRIETKILSRSFVRKTKRPNNSSANFLTTSLVRWESLPKPTFVRTKKMAQ
jgi:hypothetical protein